MSGDSKEQVSIFSKRLTYSLQCRLYLFTTYLHLSEFYLRETMGCDLRKSSMNEISSETKPDGLHLIVLFSIARISVGLLVGAIVSYRRARKTPRRKRRLCAVNWQIVDRLNWIIAPRSRAIVYIARVRSSARTSGVQARCVRVGCSLLRRKARAFWRPPSRCRFFCARLSCRGMHPAADEFRFT